MSKILVTTFLSLDGVMQAPGGPDEDKSGGFDPQEEARWRTRGDLPVVPDGEPVSGRDLAGLTL